MSDYPKSPGKDLGGFIAFKLQALRNEKELVREKPLIRLDNREEVREAPFFFDTVRGIIHRRECRAMAHLPPSGRYGLWRLDPADISLACPDCRPEATKETMKDQHTAADFLYGMVSVIDQFGAVLGERGKEFRQSDTGQALEGSIREMVKWLDQQQVEVLNVLYKSLEEIVKVVSAYDRRLNGQAEKPDHHQNGNGHTLK